MRILFTVCGRAGSKGFKNKNLKELNGIPLVYYSLAAISLYTGDHLEDDVQIAVNTDSQPLIDCVKKQNILRDIHFVDRKEELADDKSAKVDVIRDTYFSMGADFDAVLDLDITSPLRSLEDLENILEVYRENEAYELVTSVVRSRRSPYFNMVERRDDFYKKICESAFTTRQETPETYELNASMYVYRPGFLEQYITDTILDHRCGISVMKDYLVLDIDSNEDFRMMELLHRYYLNDDAGLARVYEEAKRFLK